MNRPQSIGNTALIIIAIGLLSTAMIFLLFGCAGTSNRDRFVGTPLISGCDKDAKFIADLEKAAIVNTVTNPESGDRWVGRR